MYQKSTMGQGLTGHPESRYMAAYLRERVCGWPTHRSPSRRAIARFLDHVDQPHSAAHRGQGEADYTTAGGPPGHHSPRRYARSRPGRAAQALWRRLAGRRARALGGAAAAVLLPISIIGERDTYRPKDDVDEDEGTPSSCGLLRHV